MGIVALARTLCSFGLIAADSAALGAEWKNLAPLPDKEGVAGCFGGVSHGALIVAGGANFPDKKPWEGGQKLWHDRVFVLDRPDGTWQRAGRLPRPLAYGVSVSLGDGVICVGGSDAERHYAGMFRLEWTGRALRTRELQPLPRPLANACGALLGSTLYVAGGLASPDAAETLRTVYRIDLSAAAPAWEDVEPWPGCARMIAVAAAFDGAFWLVGGTDLVAGPGGKPQRRYLRDAYRYQPGEGWTRLPDLPRPVVGAPSPAPSGPHGFFIVGGDDGTQISVLPAAHRGFSNRILGYDTRANTWFEAGLVPAPRVTAPCVAWNGAWVVPSGEVRPGVRSPDVLCFTPRTSE